MKTMANTKKSPLIFELIAECNTSKARTGVMTLIHSIVDTPVFMPVGTQVSFEINPVYIKFNYLFIYNLQLQFLFFREL